LKAQLSSQEQKAASLEQQSGQISSAKTKLEKELETIRRVSADQIAMYEENKELKSQLLNLRRTIQTVTQENVSLKDSSARKWFMVGSAVCAIGIILGLVLPNLRFRKKESWGSL
jgi:SH3 domain protein